MSKTSRPPSFADTLNEQAAKDHEVIETYRRQMEAVIREQLREFGANLTRYAKDEIARTAFAIQRHADRKLAAQWIRTVVIGLGICMAIWSSLWAVGRWQQSQINEKIDTLEYLDRPIDDRNRTLNELSQEVE